MSLDDFYLTGREQDELGIKYPENILLKYRGNGRKSLLLCYFSHCFDMYFPAGTHDIDLLYNILAQIKQSHDTSNTAEKQDILIPRYIKSLRNGLGDRAPLTEWIRIQGKLSTLRDFPDKL